MEALSRRIALVHHKLHLWDNSIGKALTEDPPKLRPQRVVEQRISQHINQHFFGSSTARRKIQQQQQQNTNDNLMFSANMTGAFGGSSANNLLLASSGSREVTGKTLKLTKKQSEEALSEMLKSVARLGVSGAMNQELEKERADVSRCCLLLLQLENWLDIAGGNEFMAVPHHHLGAVSISNELLEDCYKVVRLRFPTAMDPFDLLQKIEGDLDGMIELLAWTCAIDRRLLAVDAGFARLIDICCSVRVRKAVTSERESFVATFDQAAQSQKNVIAKLLAGYTIFLGNSNTPSYSIIGSRFDAVCHAKRLAALSVHVPHSLTTDAVASSLQIIFSQFQKQVPESLALLVDPIAPDEILGMGKSARDPANKGTMQFSRDAKVAAAWKRVQAHEGVRSMRSSSRRTNNKRSGAAGRFTSILILQRAWRNYVACRDAVRLCANLAMIKMQKRAIQQIVSWWRRRKHFWEMREVKIAEAGLRRQWVKEELKKYVKYFSTTHQSQPNNNQVMTTGGFLLSTLTSATSTRLLSAVVDEVPIDDGEDNNDYFVNDDHHQENSEENSAVNVTVSSIHDSESGGDAGVIKLHSSIKKTPQQQNNENKKNNHQETPIGITSPTRKIILSSESNVVDKLESSSTPPPPPINHQDENSIKDDVATPWRAIPIRWKQHQRETYQKHQDINFYKHVVNGSSSPPPTTSAATALQENEDDDKNKNNGSNQNQPHFIHHQHSLLHPALASPSRAQKNSMIFCAARRIQNFFRMVLFVRQTERKWMKRREPSVPVSNYSSSQLPPLTTNTTTTRVAGSAAFSLLLRRGKAVVNNKNQQRPSSATSSVLEKFRRIRREQQLLGDNYRWEESATAASDEMSQQQQRVNNNEKEKSSSPSASSSFSLSASSSSSSDQRDREVFDPIQRSLSRSSYYNDEEFEQQPQLQEISSSKMQQKNKKLKSQNSNNDCDYDASESLEIVKNSSLSHHHHHTLDRLTFHSLKELSRQNRSKQQQQQQQQQQEQEKKIFDNQQSPQQQNSSFVPSDHLLHKLSSIPTVFKIAQKGDGNILVRPTSSDPQQQTSERENEENQEDNSHFNDELTFDEAEFRKHILAQTGKSEISKEELEMHKRIAEKYLQDVERLEGHRSDEIALAAMRGEASKLLISSVSSIFVGKNHFEAFGNTAYNNNHHHNHKSNEGKNGEEKFQKKASSRWIIEELRETVSRLRATNEREILLRGKKRKNRKDNETTPPSKVQQEQQQQEPGRVLSSDEDDDTTTKKSNNFDSKIITFHPQKQRNSFQLLSPIQNRHNDDDNVGERNSIIGNNDDDQRWEEQKSETAICGLNPVEAPLVSFSIPQQQLRHPYQNWSNATQILRTIVRRGLQELIKFLKTQDLRNMFQFSEEELYRKEVVVTKRRIKRRRDPQRDDDDDNDDHSSSNDDDDDDDDDKYEEIEEQEERFVVDEMALAKQRAQAVELTLQLLCETVNATSLNDATAILSTDISKLVEDENLPIVSILRTSLTLESRRLIVPWIIITGAGKEFRDFDPEIKRKQVQREIHQADVKAQKQRRSRRTMEKDLRYQQLVVEYNRKMREREAEIQRLLKEKEEAIVEKKARRLERKQNRLGRKKDHAEQKKVRAMLREIRKEKKLFEKAEKEKRRQEEANNNHNNSSDNNKENASSKKPSSSSSSSPPPRANSAGKQKSSPTTTSPAPKKSKPAATTSTTTNQNNNQQTNNKQESKVVVTPRSASSVSSVSSASSSISSSSSSSSTSSILIDPTTGKPMITLTEFEMPPLPKKPEDEEEEAETPTKNIGASSPASSTTLNSSFLDDDDEENNNNSDDESDDQENHHDANDEKQQQQQRELCQKILLLEESEQIRFDDNAVVMANIDDEFILTFDDLERVKYQQFLSVAVANCNLNEFFNSVMRGPHSLVARWLKIPVKVKKSKELMKRRIDLMLLGALLLPFLKTLQQWFNSNFAFEGDDGGNNQQQQQEQQQDEDNYGDEEMERDEHQQQNHQLDYDDDEEEEEENYLQNETFDEEIMVIRQSVEDDENRTLEKLSMQQQQQQQQDQDESEPFALPELVGTGRGDEDEKRNNNQPQQPLQQQPQQAVAGRNNSNFLTVTNINRHDSYNHHHNNQHHHHGDDEDNVEMASRQESHHSGDHSERPEAPLGRR